MQIYAAKTVQRFDSCEPLLKTVSLSVIYTSFNTLQVVSETDLPS